MFEKKTSFELFNVRIGPELRTVREMKKRRKKREQKSQNCYISPLCCGAPCKLMSTKLCVIVGNTNVITYVRNSFKIFIGFSSPTGGKRIFPYRKRTAYITVP